MRTLGFVLGAAGIFFGIFLFFRPETDGVLGVIVATSIAGIGAYFVNYAFTGRNTFRKRKFGSGERENKDARE